MTTLGRGSKFPKLYPHAVTVREVRTCWTIKRLNLYRYLYTSFYFFYFNLRRRKTITILQQSQSQFQIKLQY